MHHGLQDHAKQKVQILVSTLDPRDILLPNIAFQYLYTWIKLVGFEPAVVNSQFYVWGGFIINQGATKLPCIYSNFPLHCKRENCFVIYYEYIYFTHDHQ